MQSGAVTNNRKADLDELQQLQREPVEVGLDEFQQRSVEVAGIDGLERCSVA